MSQLKVNSISDSAGANGNAISLASDGTCTVKATNRSSPNLIINGDFQIAQRATTNDTAGASSTYHTLDRWMTQIQAGTITESQQTLTSSDTGPWEKGFRNYMRMLNNGPIGAGASQYAEIDQRIEARNIAQSGWDYTSTSSYITLSFWLRASVAQSYVVALYTNDGTARHYPFEAALSANTWTKVTKVIPGNSGITVNNDNGKGLTVCFITAYGTNYTSNSGSFNVWNTTGGGTNRWPDMATGWATTANATFDVTGVQLEVGDFASDYFHEPYSETLRKCQRYYQKSYGDFSTSYSFKASGYGRAAVNLYEIMRANPTVNPTLTGGGGSMGTVVDDAIGTFYLTTSSLNEDQASTFSWTATAEL